MSLPDRLRAFRIPALGVGLTFVSFVILNIVGYYFQIEDGVSIFFPATAADVIGCMYFGWWGALGIFLGALVTPWLPDEPLTSTAISGLLNVAEGMIPYLIFRWRRDLHRDLHDIRSLVAFLLFGTILNSALSALIGNLLLVPRPAGEPIQFANVFMWWVSDFSAALLIATPILAFASGPLERLSGAAPVSRPRTLANAVEVTGAVILLGWLAATAMQGYLAERLERDRLDQQRAANEAASILTAMHRYYVATHEADAAAPNIESHSMIRQQHHAMLERLQDIGRDGGPDLKGAIDRVGREIDKEPMSAVPGRSPDVEESILALRAAFERRSDQMSSEHSVKRRQIRLVIGVMHQMVLAILILATAYLLRKIARPLRQIRAQVARLRREGHFDPSAVTTDFVELQTLVDALDQTSRDLRTREDALREQTMRALAASKAKSEFLAKMSHELRTPMNSIIGFAEVLREKQGDVQPERRDLFLDNILRSGRNLLRLINDLLDVAKVEAGKMEFHFYDLDLRYVIEQSAAIAQPLLEEKSQKLDRSLPGEPMIVHGDSGRLEQVFLNLLTNAQKFSPVGSTIALAATIEGETCEILVSDRGIGIDEKDQEFIFEEFAQVQDVDARNRGGTGLGLALARAMVEAHGGRIGVTSTLGAGATFCVRLPLARRIVTV